MASAMGLLRWGPDQFWKATFYEYTAAMKGYLVSKGADVEPPMTPEEFKALKAKHEAKERAKSGNRK